MLRCVLTAHKSVQVSPELSQVQRNIELERLYFASKCLYFAFKCTATPRSSRVLAHMFSLANLGKKVLSVS